MGCHNNNNSTNKNNFNDKSNNHVTTGGWWAEAEADHQSVTREEGPAAATTAMFQVPQSLHS
jgi:hypothetical protein